MLKNARLNARFPAVIHATFLIRLDVYCILQILKNTVARVHCSGRRILFELRSLIRILISFFLILDSSKISTNN